MKKVKKIIYEFNSSEKKFYKEMCFQIKRNSLLSYFEHDYRHPPFATIIDAEIKKLKNGNYGLRVTFNIFEENDIGYLEVCPKKIAQDIPEKDILNIKYDKYFKENQELSDLLDKLDKIIIEKHTLNFETKKSVDFSPELVFSILLFRPIINMSNAFFSQIGIEGFNLLKKIIKKLKGNTEDFQIHFKVSIKSEDQKREEYTECLVIFTNPNENDLDKLLLEAFEKLEEKLRNDLFISKKPISKIVYNIYGDKIQYEYTLNTNGIPLEVANKEEYKKILNSMSQNLIK